MKYRSWRHLPEEQRKAGKRAARRLYLRSYSKRPSTQARRKAYRQKNRVRISANQKARINRDKPAHLARTAPQWMAYYYRLKQDPVRYARYLKRKNVINKRRIRRLDLGRKKWRAIKADPVKHDAYKAHRRERYGLTTGLSKGRPGSVGSPIRIAQQSGEKVAALLVQLAAFVPRGFPEEIRDDLLNDLVVVVMSGEVRLPDLNDERVLRRYTLRSRRLLGETWGQMSLDDIVPGTESMRWVDTLADDHPHF